MANYANADDLYILYGKAAIRRWASIDNDNDQELVDDRIEFALTTSTEYLNDRLRRGHYPVPFTTVPHTIKFMTALYAGTILYDGRQITSTDSRDDLVRQRREFDRLLKQINRGQIKFDGIDVQSALHPVIPVEEDEEDTYAVQMRKS